MFANRKLLFYNKVLLYIPGWPGGLYVDQAGFELVETHLCLIFGVLGLKESATMPRPGGSFT